MEIFEIDNLLKLSPREFEELIKALLIKMQFKASTTKISGDGGIDIIALNEQPIVGGRYVIQCKRYAPGNNVGEPIVRELYGVMMHENANKGILISTSEFTKQAISFSQNKAIELINGNNIINLLNQYFTETDDVIKQLSQKTAGNLFKSRSITNQDLKKEQPQTIKAAANKRFTFTDLTIQDRETGLIWSQHSGLITWSAVLKYLWKINNNLYAGRSDWRLPTFTEFQTIIDFAKKWKGYENDISSLLNIIGFREINPAHYWTTTGDHNAYIISMINGNNERLPYYNIHYNYRYNILPVSIDTNKT